MVIVTRAPLAALLLAAAGCGRAEWREADARLSTAAEAARALGFVPLAGPNNTFGDFASNGEVAWRVRLDSGRAYFIAAVCTTGCDTLDFAVAGPGGAEVARDTGAGAAPRLLLQASEEGDYRITFRYGHCAAERCRWIAQVYQRRQST